MAQITNDIIYNNYDQYTGTAFHTKVVTLWYDGSIMDDTKVDNAIYFKNRIDLGGGYSCRTDFLEGKPINVKWFGAIGDGVTDDTTSFQSAISFVKSVAPATLYIPKGVYLYTSLGNLQLPGVTITGEGIEATVLQCTGSGYALQINAFASGSPTDPFINGFNMKNLSVSGNAGTTVVVYAQGMARSRWENIYVKNANPASGIGFHFAGVMLSSFINVGCSTQVTPMDHVVYEGLRLTAGTRAGLSVGNSSNNTFYQNYYEGLGIGVRLNNGDQNYFIGGSPEACRIYGLLVGSISRYNTFIGVGFENKDAVDVSDSGIYTRYINCYFSHNFRVGQARGIAVQGCYGERFEIQPGAENTSLIDITYNNWNTGSGGIFDSGTDTYKNNLFNSLTASYDRNSVIKSGLIGASAFLLQNLHDANQSINDVNASGAFSGTVNESGVNYPTPEGVGIAVDRSANFGTSTAVGSFRLWTSHDEVRALKFKKLIGVNSWSNWDEILTRSTHVLKGTSTQRPLTGIEVGEWYFDTDLGSPIWWNGVDWINANGVVV